MCAFFGGMVDRTLKKSSNRLYSNVVLGDFLGEGFKFQVVFDFFLCHNWLPRYETFRRLNPFSSRN